MKLLLIGSSGYIGSYLVDNLGVDIDGVDIVDNLKLDIHKDYEQLTIEELSKYKFILFFAGYSNRGICEKLNYSDVKYCNVDKIINFLKKLNDQQVFIFASTAAIYENYIETDASENVKIQSDRFDKYTLSMFEREIEIQKNIANKHISCKVIGLRLGTVIGASPNQRMDLILVAMLRTALFEGCIRVVDGKTWRAVLWIEDLLNCIKLLIKKQPDEQLTFFNIVSYNSTIAKIANELACKTGAIVKYFSQNDNNFGYRVSSELFSITYNYIFQGTFDKIYTSLIANVNQLFLNQMVNYNPLNQLNYQNKCRVCENDKLYIIYDFGKQPLANNFTDEKIKHDKYPLLLCKCNVCHHTQLNYNVSPELLFENYIYQSGTSFTLRNYFHLLAEKIDQLYVNEKSKTILEIACNDGYQLDEFKKLGWTTYGVDPAKNIVTIAQNKGHIVYNGFWGQDVFPNLPECDVIMGQNVIAHVPDPYRFLLSCCDSMTDKTLLVLQTSQCDMYETGEFDTVYHEHFSFFTAHSWKFLAERCGLKIVDFEKANIHGNSFVVFLKKNQDNHCEKLLNYIEYEKNLGVDNLLYYIYYKYKIDNMKKWIDKYVLSLKQNFTFVGYGAAAKGMTFLNHLKNIDLEYIVDDSTAKHHKVCPGVNTSVLPIDTIGADQRPLVIFILAWNFGDEILEKILKLRKDVKNETYIVMVYPEHKIYKIINNEIVLYTINKIKQRKISELQSQKRKSILISHFYNEEFLIRSWIRSHAHLFDRALLIDYDSTDKTVDIINEEAPSTWKVVKSKNQYFAADKVDIEVMEYERTFDSNDIKITLNTTEFLVCINMDFIKNNEKDYNLYFIHMFYMVGDDSIDNHNFKIYKDDKSIILQRNKYILNYNDSILHNYFNNIYRFLHYGYTNINYNIGRHQVNNINSDISVNSIEIYNHNMYIVKYIYTPYPEIMPRKLQIKNKYPMSDFEKGWGLQHAMNESELLKTIIDNKNKPSAYLDSTVILDDFINPMIYTKHIYDNYLL